MNIREITEDDIPALFVVRVATHENQLTLEELASLGITEETLKSRLRGTFKGWLCEVNAQVVGFAMGDRATGELWVIALLPQYIGQGIGSALLRRVEDWLEANGCARLWLTTDLDPGLKAYRFYRQHGWHDDRIENGLRYMVKDISHKQAIVSGQNCAPRRSSDVLLDHNNLEEFSDPINYDMQDRSDTGVAFYCALAQEAGGSVLEIACGTGRVTIPIAKLGLPVTGLDIVPGMLAQARSKSLGLPVRWVEGDARTFDLHEHFRLIFLTSNAFQAFVTNTEQEALLQRVYAHLHDEGLFAFETRNPLLPNTKTRAGFFVPLETSAEEKEWPSFINTNGYEVHVSTTQVYDHVAQVMHLTSYKRWHEGGEEHTKIARTALRYTFPQELAALLHYNGFTIIRQYGDWDLGPLSATSPSIIAVCRKRT